MCDPHTLCSTWSTKQGASRRHSGRSSRGCHARVASQGPVGGREKRQHALQASMEKLELMIKASQDSYSQVGGLAPNVPQLSGNTLGHTSAGSRS